MKVAIITINDYENYGNRLQNYALEKILISNNIEVSTLVESHRSIKEYLVLFGISVIYTAIHIIPNRFAHRFLKTINYKASLFYRRKNIIKFSNRFLNERRLRQKKKMIGINIDAEYDRFIAGSDQIWNTNFWNLENEDWKSNNFLLMFSNPIKRIAYAASIGRDSIDTKWIPTFVRELSKFNAISVREENAKKIIDNLKINKNTSIVLDPTLLFDANEWRSVLSLKYSDYCRKLGNYIFVFFLGDIKPDTDNLIAKISKEKKLKIININSFYDRKICECDPFEFITLIHYAKFIITDSFHVTVFSILFEIPFVVMERKQIGYSNMSTRIISLLCMTKLDNRYNNVHDLINMECNFEQSRKILEKARLDSLRWLLNSLNM